MVPNDRARGNGQKMKCRKFLVDTKKFSVCVRMMVQIAWEMLGLILEDFKGHLHMVLEEPLVRLVLQSCLSTSTIH